MCLLFVSGVLTSLDTRLNKIDGEAAQQLAAAVLGSASLEVFGEVPMKQLRADALTELSLSQKSLGPTEAIVLAKLVEVSSAVDMQRFSNRLPALGADVVVSQVQLCQHAIDAQGIADRLRALRADVVEEEVERCQHAVDMEGVADRLRALDAEIVPRQVQLCQRAIDM